MHEQIFFTSFVELINANHKAKAPMFNILASSIVKI
jgi:hypothetical protein